MLIGAQLYSVCKKCDTEEGIRETIKTMKELGYQSVQVSGFAYDAEKLRSYADEFGMHIGLTHTAAADILNNTDEVIRKHKILGADVVGIGSASGYVNGDIIRIDDFIRDFTPAVEKIQAAGLKFAFHNHYKEFYDLGGYCYMDELYEKTNWNFTLDVGWADFAGVDAVAYINKYKDRLQYVHLKDYREEREGDKAPSSRLVPIYSGLVPMDKIVQALVDVGTVKVAYVEQDNASQTPDPYGEMKKSIEAIKAHGWLK